MFENATSPHPYLKEEVERAEALAGHQVVSAQIFRIPYIVYEVDCEIQQSRRLGLLEEFLLRAAVELKPPVSGADLADLLRVDLRFVEQTYRDLVQLQALTGSPELLLRATPTGETFYHQDRLPQPPQVVTRELVAVLPFTTLSLHQPASRANKLLDDATFPDFPYSPEMQKRLHPARYRTDINQPLLLQVTAQAGQPLDRPEDGIALLRVVTWRMDRTMKYSHWAVLVVRDLLDEGVSIQLRSLDLPIYGPKDESETALRSFIETVLREKILTLGELMNITPSEVNQSPDRAFTELESRMAGAEAAARSHLTASRRTPDRAARASAGTAELLRAGDVRARLLSTLKSAKQRVLMVMPTVDEQTVDNEVVEILKTLAARRVITLIGWGISRSQPEEKNPPTERLIKKLAQITTPDGLPAVAVLWLGNQHSQDVIVDDAAHLCGSRSQFAYQGAHFPRGESVYHITLPEPVAQAARYLELLFTDSAQAEYDDWLSRAADSRDLARLISIWIGSGQFTEAYRHVLHAAQHAKPDALAFLPPLLFQAASDTLTTDTRSELLLAIGEFGSEWADPPAPGAGHPILTDMAKADRKAFVKGLQNLLKKLDPVQAQEIVDMFPSLWNSLS